MLRVAGRERCGRAWGGVGVWGVWVVLVFQKPPGDHWGGNDMMGTGANAANAAYSLLWVACVRNS